MSVETIVPELSGKRTNGFKYPHAIRLSSVRQMKARPHGEVSRAEMQHYGEVCHFSAIASQELTGAFSQKMQQNGYFDAFFSAEQRLGGVIIAGSKYGCGNPNRCDVPEHCL